MAISKQIEGYPEYYVTSAGNVWREHSNGFYLKLRPDKENIVKLYNNGKAKYMRVHRLVAIAFVPIPSKYADMSVDELDVHHINFDHFDNRASNIMWLTKAEHQQLHSESNVTKQKMSEAKKGEKNPMYGKQLTDEHKQKMSEAKKGQPNLALSKAVAQFTKEGVFIAEYASTHEAERLTKVNQGNISRCCKGKYKSAGGYKWRYAS